MSIVKNDGVRGDTGKLYFHKLVGNSDSRRRLLDGARHLCVRSLLKSSSFLLPSDSSPIVQASDIDMHGQRIRQEQIQPHTHSKHARMHATTHFIGSYPFDKKKDT